MASRIDLQKKLEEILGSRQVYYQSPGATMMKYPAIVYQKSNIRKRYANDKNYLKNIRYEVTVIDKMPDNPIIDELLSLPYSSFDRHYVSDNLNHDVIVLYY